MPNFNIVSDFTQQRGGLSGWGVPSECRAFFCLFYFVFFFFLIKILQDHVEIHLSEIQTNKNKDINLHFESKIKASQAEDASTWRRMMNQLLLLRRNNQDHFYSLLHLHLSGTSRGEDGVELRGITIPLKKKKKKKKEAGAANINHCCR